MSIDTLVPDQGATRRLTPDDFKGPARNVERTRRNSAGGREPRKPYKERHQPGPKRTPKPWPGGLPPYPDGTPRRNPGGSPRPFRQRGLIPVPRPNPGFGLKPLPPRPGLGLATATRLGRAVIPRLVPGLATALALLDLYDLVKTVVSPSKAYRPNPGNGWVKCWGDCAQNLPNHSMSGIGACNLPSACLSGQNVGAAAPVGVLPPPNNVTSWTLIYKYWVPNLNAWKGQLHSFYRRTRTGTQVDPVMVPQTEWNVPISPEVNPNLLRHAPSLPGYDPAPRPRFRRGVGGPLIGPDGLPVDPVELSPDEVSRRIEELGRNSWEVASPVIRPGVPVNPRPGQPPDATPGPGAPPDTKPVDPPAKRKPQLHKRRKPPRREKQKKVRGPIFWFFAIADAMSESAEVVDALYEALPEDVKKRWERDRKISNADAGRHALIDQAGQYGIDGADWKAQAVFHNFHKIDGAEALRNIIANQVEDKLIGGLHRNLPPNMINAAEDGQKAYAKLVDKALKELGLKESE